MQVARHRAFQGLPGSSDLQNAQVSTETYLNRSLLPDLQASFDTCAYGRCQQRPVEIRMPAVSKEACKSGKRDLLVSKRDLLVSKRDLLISKRGLFTPWRTRACPVQSKRGLRIWQKRPTNEQKRPAYLAKETYY